MTHEDIARWRVQFACALSAIGADEDMPEVHLICDLALKALTPPEERLTIPKDVLRKATEFMGRADDAGFLARAILRLDMDAPVPYEKGCTRPAKAVRSTPQKETE